MSTFLDTPIDYLRGIGPKKGAVLKKELRIFTYHDFLHYFPFRYVDRTEIHKIIDVPNIEGYVQLRGKVYGVKEVGVGRAKRLSATFRDDSGIIELVWFKGANWVKKSLKPDTSYKLYGKAKRFGLKWNISHPELEEYGAPNSQETGLQ